MSQRSIYRFAPGTVRHRTAIALQDGRFLEVKPIRHMFANGDAWTANFMGKGALLTDGVNMGKITVDTSTSKINPEIKLRKDDLANVKRRYKDVNVGIHETMVRLTRLNETSRDLCTYQIDAERYLTKLQWEKKESNREIELRKSVLAGFKKQHEEVAVEIREAINHLAHLNDTFQHLCTYQIDAERYLTKLQLEQYESSDGQGGVTVGV
jgi:chromosome segregation ATPase